MQVLKGLIGGLSVLFLVSCSQQPIALNTGVVPDNKYDSEFTESVCPIVVTVTCSAMADCFD